MLFNLLEMHACEGPVIRTKFTRFHIVPAVHGRTSGFGSHVEISARLKSLKPELVFLEAELNDLSLTDSEFDACLGASAKVIPIDVPQKTTRRRLTERLLGHPVEAIGLMRAAKENACGSVSDATRTRFEWEEKFPTAYRTIFEERECAMVAAIAATLERDRNCRLNPLSAPLDVAIVCGAAHVVGIQKALNDDRMRTVPLAYRTMCDAWRLPYHSWPLVLVLYIGLPLAFLGPWPYWLAYKIKESKKVNGEAGDQSQKDKECVLNR